MLRGKLPLIPSLSNGSRVDKECSMAQHDYQPPVSDLIALGERPLRKREPHDYRAMGIDEEHIGELARMSVDPAFNPEDDDDDRPEVFAQMHAMRALCQIGTQATIEPLARLLQYEPTADYDEINDWFMEDIPKAFGNMGAVAIPCCAQLLRDNRWHTHSRFAAASALTKIAQRDPQTRQECVRLIVEQLERFGENEPEWNGWLVAELVDLKAVEAASLIERAFAADLVDETVIGDWDEVQADLGLRPPLTKKEYEEKRRHRETAVGWLSPEDELSDEELAEELVDEWDDSGDDAWERLSADEDQIEEPPEPEEPVRMAMPEDVYSADERRELAKHRKKQRKAAERAKAREKRKK
jgi:hypothetical protein